MLELGVGWAKVWDCRIPVIAQVHGNCLAGGTDLALHCDIVVAAGDARLGFPPVRSMGVPPTNMWLYHLGPQWTKRLLFTGDTVSGAEAAAIGPGPGRRAGRGARRRTRCPWPAGLPSSGATSWRPTSGWSTRGSS